jgi:hypothetical protein
MAIISPRKAVALHCKECIYDNNCSGNWRKQVEACTIADCALFDHRPITGVGQHLRRENLLASLSDAEREIASKRSANRVANLANGRNAAVGMVGTAM